MNSNTISPYAWVSAFFGGLLMGGSRGLAITITVLSRYKFGDRFYNFRTYLAGAFAIWVIDWFRNVFGIVDMFTGGMAGMFGQFLGVQTQRPMSLFQFVLPLYLLVGGFHLIYGKVMEMRGKVWWGYSTGVPWLGLMRDIEYVRDNKFLSWLFSDWTLYRFVEPGMFFLLNLFIGNVLHDQYTSTWLFGASIGLFLQNKALVDDQKRKLKDMRDAEIENRFLADAMAGRDKREIYGYATLPVSKEFHTFKFGGQPGDPGNPPAGGGVRRPNVPPTPGNPGAQTRMADVVAETMGRRPAGPPPAPYPVPPQPQTHVPPAPVGMPPTHNAYYAQPFVQQSRSQVPPPPPPANLRPQQPHWQMPDWMRDNQPPAGPPRQPPQG